MREIIEERKPIVANEEKNDLLSNLIQASLKENSSKGEYEFIPQDLLGNTWVFLRVCSLPGCFVYSIHSCQKVVK
jgi:hypothetical protein